MAVFFKGNNIAKLIIELNLYILDNYIENLEDLLENKIKKFEDWADEELEGLTEEQRNEYSDSLSDDYWIISKAFPNILRSSLFVTCYSLLEYALISLCEQLQKQKGLKKESKKYKIENILNAKDYLEGETKICFHDQIPSWNDINNYRLVRNLIVHNQGRLDNSDNSNKAKKVRNFINKNKKNWVELEDKYYLEDKCIQIIQFKKGFLKEVKKTIKDFSKELSKTLK